MKRVMMCGGNSKMTEALKAALKGKESIPVASPQATRHVIDHTTCINVEDEIEYMKWIDKRNAAQPVAGTTPQAERLVAKLKAARTAWQEDFGVPVSEKYANFLEAIGKLTDYVDARAVAPVETPDAKVLWRERLKKLSFLITGNDYAFFAENPQIEESLKVYVESLNETAECAPDQTRLTAEQFYDNQDKFNFFPDESRGIGAIWAFAEAFRDKSEAELRAKLAEQEKERDLYALLRGICEEVIDWLGTLSYDGIDDAKSVLDHPLSKDIRLKLQQMYDHPLDNKLLIRTDVLEAKLERADAAEAEAAALRERERWIPVEEKLPPDAPKKSWKDNERQYRCSEQVEAYNGSRYVAEVLTNPKGESVWVCGDETVKNVTHWKALSVGPQATANFMQLLPGGMCFAHGRYEGYQCPQWPKCITDPQKQEYLAQAQTLNATTFGDAGEG